MRSSCGICESMRALMASSPRLFPSLESLYDCFLRRGNHPYLRGQRLPAGLEEQRRLNYSNLVSLSFERRKTLLDHLVDTGEHNSVKPFELARVAEYDGPQLLAVHLAARREDPASKGVDDSLPSLRVRKVGLVSQKVGVYGGGSKLLQYRGDLRLACTYASGETYYEHAYLKLGNLEHSTVGPIHGQRRHE